MAETNWDIVKFTIFLILDVITLFINWKLAITFFKNQQNNLIPIAMISIPWIETIIVLVLNYHFFYINWI